MSDNETCAVCGVTADEPRVQLIEGNFARIRVRAQDVVVIAAKSKVSDQLRQVILDQLRIMFPGNKILVLDEGYQIGVIAPICDEDCDQDEDEL